MITYSHAIKALEYLLDKVGETSWRNWILKDIELWQTRQDVSHYLSAYGGMGSLNDLWISARNGHTVMDFQESWVNVALTLVRDLAFRLARLRQKETESECKAIYTKWFLGLIPLLRIRTSDRIVIDGILRTTRKILRLDGWHCLSCGYLETQPDKVEEYLARTVLPKKISKAKTANDLIRIVDMALNGTTTEIQKLRDQIYTCIVNSGIAVTNRQGWVRPCPQCGSNDTEVCYWIRKGRRFTLRN